MDTLKTCSGEKISSVSDWVKNQIKQEEIDKYLENNHDFIDDAKIKQTLQDNQKVSKERIRGILEKAHEINLMDDADVAALVNVTDPDLRQEVFQAAEEIKKQVAGVPYIMEFTFGEYGYVCDGRNTTGGLMLSFTAITK